MRAHESQSPAWPPVLASRTHDEEVCVQESRSDDRRSKRALKRPWPLCFYGCPYLNTRIYLLGGVDFGGVSWGILILSLNGGGGMGRGAARLILVSRCCGGSCEGGVGHWEV